jgi:hypothetical protein
MERGYVLYKTDADFVRFPGLRWVNPCKAKLSRVLCRGKPGALAEGNKFLNSRQLLERSGSASPRGLDRLRRK